MAHYYYHRPLSMFLQIGFSTGFLLDALREPTFPKNRRFIEYLKWYNLSDIPPVLIGRVEKPTFKSS